MQLVLPGVLDTAQLQQAQALLAQGHWLAGTHTAGQQSAQVKNNQQLDAADPSTQQLQQWMLAALQRHVLFFSSALPKKIWPPAFNRYAGGQAYGDHVDQGIRTRDGLRLRADLSCTLFLNEPEAYEGGELVIAGAPGIKLKAGDALLYGGHTVHRVEPVTRGARLACFFWVESLVRSHEQRELLFNMDRALTALRERDGESAEAVALMGSYHHLLRLWADS
jgi:PKHD-type hydroxylase